MSIRENFLPVKAHIKEHPARFHRFDAVWTPTVLLLDAAGKERVRLEGYLPNSDFMAALRAASPSCRRKYAEWSLSLAITISRQKRCTGGLSRSTARPTITLSWVAEELRSKYPSSVWASKAVLWLH